MIYFDSLKFEKCLNFDQKMGKINSVNINENSVKSL